MSHGLQGHTGSARTRTRTLTTAPIDRDQLPEEQANAPLPEEVLAMRATVSNWRSEWRVEQQSEQEYWQGGQGHYISRLMSRSSFPRNQAERDYVQAVPPAFPTKATGDLYLEQSNHLAQIRHLRDTDNAPVKSSR
jgi:hypothetical protein